ncbi:MAG: thioredoxin domain-containing protein [Opitutales bacterium]|nr:thioredoxin domain-containing protein [Opitutales bacterium]
MANQLANEKSLYLRQHADNPVNWYPWGEEALKRAREENKPLLVSVGYSSCHWCHVMAHESFENEFIADLMNRNFVCVKVDREERPDLDQIYMEAVQMVANHGGWPLNAFCLPDGRPFFGGTYFPPEDKGNGMIPWPQLLMRIKDYWDREKDKLEENAENIVHNLGAMNMPKISGAAVIDEAALTKAAKSFSEKHDDDFGGFGEAPKFPPAMALRGLLEYQRLLQSGKIEESGFSERIDQIVETTLKGMAHGGLYDQVGGGFTRYSVDRFWLIPHFEKMLYDNGLLLSLYVRGYQRYRRPLYRAVAEETVGWMLREMDAPSGLFHASLDADSEGKEGIFYTWTPAEVQAVLGEEEGRAFCRAYNITEEGNFEEGRSNPALVEPDFASREKWSEARGKLLAAREQRVRPGKDEKGILSWNSLALGALAEAGFFFGRNAWWERARKGFDFILEHMRQPNGLLYALCEDRPRQEAFLDDYAFLAESLLTFASLATARGEDSTRYWEAAKDLVEQVEKDFGDPDGVGYYFTGEHHEKLAARKKEWWDNATPSGNACLYHVFTQLYALTGESRYEERAKSLRRAYPGYLVNAAPAISHAFAAFAAERAGIGVLRVKNFEQYDELVAFLREHTWQKILVVAASAEDQPDGLQLCIGQTCLPPARSVAELAERFGA